MDTVDSVFSVNVVVLSRASCCQHAAAPRSDVGLSVSLRSYEP